jgi:CBS domain-containing protein
MIVSQILREKGDLVFTVTPNETVAEAAAMLHERKVGAMVVLGERDQVMGIISERDIVRVIARHGAEALSSPVSGCMTSQVIFASPEETMDDLLGRMTDRRVRHLPVIRDGRLCGIVSIGDLVKRKIAETQAEAEELKAYISA